jgi:hypothetical protein
VPPGEDDGSVGESAVDGEVRRGGLAGEHAAPTQATTAMSTRTSRRGMPESSTAATQRCRPIRVVWTYPMSGCTAAAICAVAAFSAAVVLNGYPAVLG